MIRRDWIDAGRKQERKTYFVCCLAGEQIKWIGSKVMSGIMARGISYDGMGSG